LLILLRVLFLKVPQKPASFADHHEKTAAGMEILFVGLKMIRERIDFLRKQSNLYRRRTRVFGMAFELINHRCSFFFN